MKINKLLMGLKFFVIIISALFCFFTFSEPVVAAKVPRCTDAKPVTAPTIIGTISGNQSITLTWTEGQDPITHYLLEYGLSKDNMLYGAQNIGPKGTTSYTVNQLTNGTRYYFRVNAVNNCRLKASHTESAVPGNPGQITNSEVKIPRLSFYKPALNSSPSASPEGQKGAKEPVKSTIESKEICTNGCYGWHLLISEIALMLIFFILIQKYTFIKPTFVLLIPVFTSLIFYLINKGCTSKGFMCEYFYLLTIVTFILITTFQRQRLITQAMKKSKGGSKND